MDPKNFNIRVERVNLILWGNSGLKKLLGDRLQNQRKEMNEYLRFFYDCLGIRW